VPRFAEDCSMESTQRQRLILGIAAVALVAGLCIAAVWSVRGRLQMAAAPVATASDGAALAAENARLRAEIARLTTERNAALARPPAARFATPPAAAPAPDAETVPPAAPARPVHPATPAEPPAGSGGFTEPQTFTSVSTAN
jgi:hypothetical protein